MTAIPDDRVSDEAAGEIAAVAVIKNGLKPAIDERRSIAFARSAVAKFRQEFGEQGLILEMIEGARQGAEALNVEVFHGVIEVVQNAEGQGASEVRLGLASAGNDRYLLLVHDGAHVEFRQLVAMSYAFLSTKREDAASTGRFGVGLKDASPDRFGPRDPLRSLPRGDRAGRAAHDPGGASREGLLRPAVSDPGHGLHTR